MRSHQSAADKSFTYYALLEGFDKSGCPVCRFMQEYSLRYLDALFYEQVNDVGIRRKLRAAHGFCNWHAWLARKLASSALGVAIIAKDLITQEITRIDDLLRHALVARTLRPTGNRISPKSLLTFLGGAQEKGICPACEIVLEHERHALETILNFLHDADFVRRFEASAALCMIHTRRAAEGNGSHPYLHLLIDIQRRKYAHLIGELEEFCRKYDHRFSHESWGGESDSWLRAIELLAGKPDVFGNEVHRKGLGYARTRWWIRLMDSCVRWALGGTPLNPMKHHRERKSEADPAEHQRSAHVPRRSQDRTFPDERE
ncbi:MAG TPA: DUF6062 family protein [Candidatus Tectomicrobia bacterium]|nr:DUF6062 family protein [Candidatus Tectomicrobia bacterium]